MQEVKPAKCPKCADLEYRPLQIGNDQDGWQITNDWECDACGHTEDNQGQCDFCKSVVDETFINPKEAQGQIRHICDFCIESN